MPLTCPKCEQELPSWVDDEDAKDRARICILEASCLFVPCDDLSCRALKSPATKLDWEIATEHWRSHRYMHGCSHGN